MPHPLPYEHITKSDHFQLVGGLERPSDSGPSVGPVPILCVCGSTDVSYVLQYIAMLQLSVSHHSKGPCNIGIHLRPSVYHMVEPPTV